MSIENDCNSDPTVSEQAEKVRKLAEDINPSKDIIPDSEAEATTVPLEDGQLGGTVDQDSVK